MIPAEAKARHRRPQRGGELRANRSEEDAYLAWCRKHQMVAFTVDSVVAYEVAVGYLFIEHDPSYVGRHREHR